MSLSAEEANSLRKPSSRLPSSLSAQAQSAHFVFDDPAIGKVRFNQHRRIGTIHPRRAAWPRPRRLRSRNAAAATAAGKSIITSIAPTSSTWTTRALVQDGREPVELDDESVRASVHYSEIDAEHVLHVNTAYPGIIAHIFYRTADGDEVQAHLLIDGNHRAARCLQENQPYFAYLLSEEESRAIVIRSPDRPGGLDRPGAGHAANDLHPETTRAYETKFAASRPLAYRSRWASAGSATDDRRGLEPFDVYVSRALGPRKWDVAGQPLIDLWMGHGAS